MSADGAVSDDTTDVDDSGGYEGESGEVVEGGQTGGTEGAAAQSRKERRANAFQEAKENARLAREEAAREREERERLGREVAELRGRWEQAQQQQQRDAKDPYADKIQALEDEAQMHLERVANSKDPAVQKAELRAYNAKMREAAKLDMRRDLENEARKNPRQQQSQMNPRDAAMLTALEAEYPAIGDKKFRNVADGYVALLMARGRPDSLATLREACALAAQELKVGGVDSGKPSNVRRGAYSGFSSGEGAGGGGETSRDDVPIGRTEEALAIALANRRGKGETKEQAIAAWKKSVAPGVKRRLAADE